MRRTPAYHGLMFPTYRVHFSHLRPVLLMLLFQCPQANEDAALKFLIIRLHLVLKANAASARVPVPLMLRTVLSYQTGVACRQMLVYISVHPGLQFLQLGVTGDRQTPHRMPNVLNYRSCLSVEMRQRLRGRFWLCRSGGRQPARRRQRCWLLRY